MNQYQPKIESEFTETVIEVKRVSKKTKGGNQIGFTALMAIGDKKGRVGLGHAHAKDVSSAIQKANKRAKKAMITLATSNRTITHEVTYKFKAAQVIIRPAKEGSGLIAGGAVRVLADVAGIKDLVAKIKGSNNKSVNAWCAFKAFAKLR